MNDKFGQFDWKCWKDERPIHNEYIYVFDSNEPEIGIGVGIQGEYEMNDDYYWCYVFMPDPPKIEKKKLHPCAVMSGCSNDYILALEERIEWLENQIADIKNIYMGKGITKA